MMSKLKQYAEIVLLAGTLAGAVWVRAEYKIRRIVKEEIGFAMFAIYEVCSDEQLERARKLWEASK